MNELTERQKIILALVIRSYTETAQPVGSGRLVEQFNLDVSSATVRNELVTLTDLGFLRQPHTSAGRIPTEDGYRYFVRQLMGHTDLPAPTRRMITHQFYQAGTDMERWMQLAASVLAHQAQAASLVTAPRTERAIYKHLELISTHSHQALLVLVLSGGEVRQQMLTLAEPVSQEQLSAVADAINERCSGKDYAAINRIPQSLTALEQDIQKLVLEDMHKFTDIPTGELYRDGLTNVLSEPEFSEVDFSRRALHILEERSLLDDLLRRTVLASDSEGVHVIIGGEGNWEELRECSMVLARYGVPGLAMGTLGVLGPMRMPYGRTISTVRFVAGLLSDLVEDVMTE
jgi:heat-inducible transcriptional repressor